MSKTLILGCAGYIGSVLTPVLLNAGYRVIGVDNLQYNNGEAILGFLGDKNFEFYKEDVRNTLRITQLANKCDIIIPLAALVGEPICNKNKEEASEINYWSIHNLLKNISPAHRVIYPNTNSGYGNTDGLKECIESDKLNPISVYGKTKCRAENEILQRENGVSLRLATVFGVSPRMRMDLLVNTFTEKLLRDRELSIYEPHFKRNIVHIKDVASAFHHFVTYYRYQGVYNVGIPEYSPSKWELAISIREILGIDGNILSIEGKDPDQRNYVISNNKILGTGFKFQYKLEDGVKGLSKFCLLFGNEKTKEMKNA